MFFIQKTLKIISSTDYKKILSFGSLAFTILINYSLLKILKDGFIVKNMGAEAIGFLKFYFLIPITMLFLLIYTKCSNSFSQKNIFIGTGIIFFFFFCFLFINFFWLNLGIFTKEEITYFQNFVPRLKWFVIIGLNWQYSLLYVLSELWGAIMYTLFFFQLTNSIFSSHEAKTQYPPIILLGTLSLPFAGWLIDIVHGSPFNIIMFVLLINLLTIIVYVLISKKFEIQLKVYKKKDSQKSLIESFRFILLSKKLWLLFIMIISLGISLNVVEVFWKGKLGKISHSVEEYVQNMGRIQALQGWISIGFILAGMLILEKFSWKFSSLIVPIFLFCLGSLFFILIFKYQDMNKILFWGLAHTIAGKCLKYAFFDPSKELVYISLDKDSKTKGKAAVDILGGRFGKSGLGIVESIVFFMFPTKNFDNTTIFFFTVFLIITILWIQAIIALDKKLNWQEKKKR